jgi:hypothetical protein
MKNGIFKNEHSILGEVKVLSLIFIGYIVTIINPISWLVYLIIYKLGSSAGETKNTIRMASQWFSFLVSSLSYVVLIGYLIYLGSK